MSENSRLRIVRGMLKLSQQDLARELGRKQGSVSDIERGRNKVDGIVDLLRLRFNVNPVWLKEGTGEVFMKKPPELEGRSSGVPYFNVPLSEIANARLSEFNEDPEFYVNFRPFNDCTAYLPVYGDSMYPKYANGDLIAVKECPNADVILWGEAYLVMTNSSSNTMTTLKLLFEHPDGTKIILRASNPNFRGDTIIERSSICALYIVKGKISRSHI